MTAYFHGRGPVAVKVVCARCKMHMANVYRSEGGPLYATHVLADKGSIDRPDRYWQNRATLPERHSSATNALRLHLLVPPLPKLDPTRSRSAGWTEGLTLQCRRCRVPCEVDWTAVLRAYAASVKSQRTEVYRVAVPAAANA